jgi:hypothetical protein
MTSFQPTHPGQANSDVTYSCSSPLSDNGQPVKPTPERRTMEEPKQASPQSVTVVPDVFSDHRPLRGPHHPDIRTTGPRARRTERDGALSVLQRATW